MGTAYYQGLSQWSSGEYADANNLQDDLAIITGNNGFGYRVDDYGDTNASATQLAVTGTILDADGLIEQNTDVDVFTFTTGAGTIDIWVDAFERSPNLDILAELYDFSGNLIVSSNPNNSLDASMLVTVGEGQYFLTVSGVGKGDPLNGGYSDYGSLGWYYVSGNIVTPSESFLAITQTDAVKSEGDAGSTAITFTVTRSGDVSQAATVDYAVFGGGKRGEKGGPKKSPTFLDAAGGTNVAATFGVDYTSDFGASIDSGASHPELSRVQSTEHSGEFVDWHHERVHELAEWLHEPFDSHFDDSGEVTGDLHEQFESRHEGWHADLDAKFDEIFSHIGDWLHQV